MTGPGEVVSMRTRWGRPRPRREAVSYAVIAVVVSEDKAWACDCDCDLPLADCEEERRGVPALSVRW